MPRDENRIEPFLEVLRKVWKESPDLRFGQLVSNALGKNSFYLEDDKALERIEEFSSRQSLLSAFSPKSEASSLLIDALGRDIAFEEIQRALSAHNELFFERVKEYCTVTDKKTLPYGIPNNSIECGIPLESSRVAIGWTDDWLSFHTLADLTLHYSMACQGDVQHLSRVLQRSVLNPINNLGYKEGFEPEENIPIRAFINGDGGFVPPAPDGSVFEKNHTHYTYSEGEMDEQSVRNVLINVAEHGIIGELLLLISSDDVEEFSLKFGGEIPESPINKVNYCLGRFDGYEVWVKPWVPKDIVVAVDTGTEEKVMPDGEVIPAVKALAYRYDPDSGKEFRIEALHPDRPLEAQIIVRKFGVAPVNRQMMAVHQFNQKFGCYTFYN